MNVNNPELIVNIVGLPGSGKSTQCGYLTTAGYELYRPSDTLRAYAARHSRVLRGRQDYIDCHEELIAADPDAMITSVLESSAARLCIDGLRAPASMNKLRRLYGRHAILIALECSAELRFEHTLSDETRSGHRRHDAFAQFLADEAPDYHNDNPFMPSMDDMFAQADYTIDASQSKEGVRDEVNLILCDRVASLA